MDVSAKIKQTKTLLPKCHDYQTERKYCIS